LDERRGARLHQRVENKQAINLKIVYFYLLTDLH
jgi:hypothetical protein